MNCTLTIKTDEGTTIDKPGRTGTMTDEQLPELVFGGLLKDSDTIWITGNDVLTILGESLLSHIVGAIVHLVGAFLDIESFGIGYLTLSLHWTSLTMCTGWYEGCSLSLSAICLATKALLACAWHWWLMPKQECSNWYVLIRKSEDPWTDEAWRCQVQSGLADDGITSFIDFEDFVLELSPSFSFIVFLLATDMLIEALIICRFCTRF